MNERDAPQPLDTTHPAARDERWVFGYGSLIWRPAFPFEERAPARLDGWVRRFWQWSTDHRGVPGAPGLVATLVSRPGASVWGMAFRLSPATYAEVMADLDVREQGGYSRHVEELALRDGRRVPAELYVGTEENPSYAGPRPVEEIAAVVRRARGPSGPNDEYVLELAAALERLGIHDEHVVALAEHVAGGSGAP